MGIIKMGLMQLVNDSGIEPGSFRLSPIDNVENCILRYTNQQLAVIH